LYVRDLHAFSGAILIIHVEKAMKKSAINARVFSRYVRMIQVFYVRNVRLLSSKTRKARVVPRSRNHSRLPMGKLF
jgi:hypothetical protein